MKNTKIVALVATVALLVLGAAFTSFAAKYNWYQQDDEWRCKDKNGDDIYADWAKSGADWYWLDDEGYMTKEALVDDDTYYVDADGKRVSDKWEKIADEEGDEHWYYFQVGGKKLTAKKDEPKVVTVQGKKYIFNEAGYMLTGWIQPEFGEVDDDDAAWQTGLYYCGDEDDGAVTFGWRQISVVDNAEDVIDQDYWFYFQPSGKKFAATADESKEEGEVYLREKAINGKKYAFNDFGVMKAAWEAVYAEEATASASSVEEFAWFKSVDDGSKFANGWFRVVPAEGFDADNNAEDTAKWFYAKGGKLYNNTIKTIGGKKYGFNAAGEMVVGLCAAELVDGKFSEWALVPDSEDQALGIDDVDVFEFFTTQDEYKLYYFSNDEDNDGSMKTGAQKVTVDGDEYDFYFSTKAGSKGQGLTGKQGNKYYYNGKKVAANDEVADYLIYALDPEGFVLPGEYAEFKNSEGEVNAATNVIISKTGAVASSGTKKDGNGWKATFKKKNSTYEKGYWVVEEIE